MDQVKGNIDVSMISETKIDDSFPLENFLIGGFSRPYRLDRDLLGRGILLYVRKISRQTYLRWKQNRLKVFI